MRINNTFKRYIANQIGNCANSFIQKCCSVELYLVLSLARDIFRLRILWQPYMALAAPHCSWIQDLDALLRLLGKASAERRLKKNIVRHCQSTLQQQMLWKNVLFMKNVQKNEKNSQTSFKFRSILFFFWSKSLFRLFRGRGQKQTRSRRLRFQSLTWKEWASVRFALQAKRQVPVRCTWILASSKSKSPAGPSNFLLCWNFHERLRYLLSANNTLALRSLSWFLLEVHDFCNCC